MSTAALRAVLARIEAYKARTPHRSKGIEASLNRAIAAALGKPVTAGSRPAPSFFDDMLLAVSMVPPGHGWTICSDGYAGCGPHDPDESFELVGHYQTPAIALIAAVLRARVELAEPMPSRWELWDAGQRAQVAA